MNNLRKAQLCQLDLLIEFDRICKNNNIKYQLVSGTLLGAIRHKGFIPWDDDLDVGLLREDYNRFLEVYKKDIKEDYIVDNWDENKKYGLGYAKMKVKNTHYLEEDAKKVKINDGIFIDIFPFDNWYKDEKNGKKNHKKMSFWARLYRFKKGYTRPSFIKKIGVFTYRVIGLFFTDQFIKNRIDYYISLGEHNSEYLVNTFGFAERDYIYRTNFSTLMDGEFEGYKFPITKEYDKTLSLIYGDYMTPPPEGEREDRHGIIKLDFGNYIPKNKKYKEEIEHEKK